MFSLVGFAQPYSINWHKIAGGGGTGVGGPYHLSGTIGQADASGALNGGQYSLTGGFWSFANVVQTPGAPLLSIIYVGGWSVVSWSTSATGWTLQTNAGLVPSAWGDYLGPIVNNRITNSTASGDLFFRLKQ
ncbi:MAG: hypothetical protein ABSH48_13035 [Verrucomicrobiota bacterium]